MRVCFPTCHECRVKGRSSLSRPPLSDTTRDQQSSPQLGLLVILMWTTRLLRPVKRRRLNPIRFIQEADFFATFDRKIHTRINTNTNLAGGSRAPEDEATAAAKSRKISVSNRSYATISANEIPPAAPRKSNVAA